MTYKTNEKKRIPFLFCFRLICILRYISTMEIFFLPPILFRISKCHREVFFILNSTVFKTHVYYIMNSFIQERPDREMLVSSLSIDQTVSQGIRSHLRFQSPVCPSRSDSTRLTRQEVTAMASVSHCTCDNSGRVTLHVALTPRCVQVGVGILSMTLSLSPCRENPKRVLTGQRRMKAFSFCSC